MNVGSFYKRLLEIETPARQLDLLFEQVSEWRGAECFGHCEALLQLAKPADLPAEVALGVLTCTRGLGFYTPSRKQYKRAVELALAGKHDETLNSAYFRRL